MPTQVKVLPIGERHHAYAKELGDKLSAAGIRVEVDDRNEKIGYKIREAQLDKTPYMLVCGDKEVESGEVSVRHRAKGDIGSMSIDAFLELALKEIREKTID